MTFAGGPELSDAEALGSTTPMQMCAELMAVKSWLRGELAELHKELAAARAKLRRIRAATKTQRGPDATQKRRSVRKHLRSSRRTGKGRAPAPVSDRASRLLPARIWAGGGQ